MFAVPKQRAVGQLCGHLGLTGVDMAPCRWPTRWAILSFVALAATLFAQVSDVEVPYSSVFRESGTWYKDPLRTQIWSADPQLKVGDDSLRFGGAGLSLGTDLDTPFRLSGPPQDAMFRLWRLYIDIPQSYVEIIASDNANQTKHDRESGVIGVIGTDFRLYLQLTDRLQLTAGGSYIYLPFKNTGGFQGSGFFGDSFNVGADADADLDLFAQATFDGTIGEWDFFVTDRIGIENRNTGLYSYADHEARLNFLEINDFDKADRLGRYSLGGSHYDDYEGDGFEDRSDSDSRWDYGTGGKYNRFTLGFARQLPTDTRASITFFRSDTWDDDDNRNANDDHDWSHGVNVSLRNQHYNVRFKPYATYTASTGKDDGYWQHAARIGFSGPLTDYTDINANVGHAWRSGGTDDQNDERSTLWHISLHNELNALTSHRLSYTRSIVEPNNEIHTTLAYSLHRTLGPRLEGTLYASWTEEDESGGQGDGRNETVYRVGAGLTYDASSRLTLRLTAFFVAMHEEDSDDDYKAYRVRLSADYEMTETVSLFVSYEYIREEEDTPGQSFYENVVRARLTKRW